MLPALLALTLAPGPDVVLRFADPRIAESSSLVAAATGDHLYTANDSGDSARVFEVDGRGRSVAVHRLPATRVVDVEDAALGPGSTLYLADIGDNRAGRRSVSVLRVPLPFHGASPRRTELTYEDGPHDAEALLVHPRTGQLLLVTKELLEAGVYAAPQPLAGGQLRRVGAVRVRPTGTPGGPAPQAAAQLLVTGGAVSPDGRRLALRTYTDAYVYDVRGDDLVAALRGVPRVVPLPATSQGEAVTWTRDGSALLTSSEGPRAPVHRVPVPPGAAGGSRTVDHPAPAAAAQPDPAPTDQPDPAANQSDPATADQPAPAAAEPARAAPARRPLLLAALSATLAGVLLVLRRRRRE